MSVEIPTTTTNTTTTTTKPSTGTVKTARARAESVMPEFTEEVANLTVVPGGKAILPCHVTHLGPYKVVRVFYTSSLTFLNHQGCLGQRQTDNDGNS